MYTYYGTCTDWLALNHIDYNFFYFQENTAVGDDAISIEELPVCTYMYMYYIFSYCIYTISLLPFWWLLRGFLNPSQLSLSKADDIVHVCM